MFLSQLQNEIEDNRSSVMLSNVQSSTNATLESSKISNALEIQDVRMAVNRSLQPGMRMRVQPVARQRFRYRIEGRRFLKNSRGRPMSIRVGSCFQ